MLSRAVTRTALLALSIFALSSCSRSLPTFRYRLTVEIETPLGPRIGSSVIEVRTVDRGSGFPGPEAGGIRHGIVGDAVYIRLPDGRYLFALLRDNGPNPTNFPSAAPFWAFSHQLPENRSNYASTLVALTRALGKAELPREHYPVFAIFDDIRRPETVRSVSPDRFDRIIGGKLRSVNIQITKDPITDQIKSVLPWATPSFKTMLDGSPTHNSQDLANSLTVLDFRQYDLNK